MTIPLPTTQVAISRKQINYESYYESDEDYTEILASVPAHIYAVTGSNNSSEAGVTMVKSTRLVADLCDLKVDDLVRDLNTGSVYIVQSCDNIRAFIPQTTAQLQYVSR